MPNLWMRDMFELHRAFSSSYSVTQDPSMSSEVFQIVALKSSCQCKRNALLAHTLDSRYITLIKNYFF